MYAPASSHTQNGISRRLHSSSSRVAMDVSGPHRCHSVAQAEMLKKKLVFCYFVYKLTEKRRRRYWVHPFNIERGLKGAFATMMIELRGDEAKFFDYFRMSIRSFDELAARTSDALKSEITCMRQPVPPLEMLAVTLRYLGSGCSINNLHFTYRLGASTLCKILRKVCATIWNTFNKECFPPFTTERWLQISSAFEKSANFPHCLGAMDEKHIRISQPTTSGSFHSDSGKISMLVLFAVADVDYNFLHIDVMGTLERDTPPHGNSTFYGRLLDGSLKLPADGPLPNTAQPDVPYVFAGGESIGLQPHVVRPFKGRNLTKTKKVFNYRLGRAHRYAECTFGLLSNKWEIFQRTMDVEADFAISIVKTCCLLHNYVRSRDGYNFVDTLSIVGLAESKGTPLSLQAKTSQVIRNSFAEYFESDAGKVPWQENCI